jgi:hypothetical protein
MEIRLLDIAQRELDKAVEYYNAESTGLGDVFLLEVLATFKRINVFLTRGIHTLTIAAAVRREGSRMESLIKFSNLKFWLSPSPTCIDDRNTGVIGGASSALLFF